MIVTMKPEVHLIDTTKRHMKTCKALIDIMTKEVEFVEGEGGMSQYRGWGSQAEMEGALELFATEPHGSVLESVTMTWIIKNVSRAFQQQLTRTRLAGYSCASLRVMNVGRFASEGRYTMPEELNEDQRNDYFEVMHHIQSAYNKFVDNGMPIEAARGILPLNIHSNVGFMINFQSFRHMMSIRMCKTAQGEFRKVADIMKVKVEKVFGPIFGDMIHAPCELDQKCKRPKYYCGRFGLCK